MSLSHFNQSKDTKNLDTFGHKSQKISNKTTSLVREISTKEVIENEGFVFKGEKIKCPFHNEKTGSLSVKKGATFYKCFGCDASGDSIKFIMEYRNLSFVEAVEYLANQFNISIEYENDSEQAAKQRNLIAKCYEVNQLYLSECQNSKATAVKYLTNRNFKQSTIEKFGIGYDNATFHVNRDITAEQKKIATNDLKIINQVGTSMFFYRVIFPIYNHSSKLVAFGGRRIDDNNRKAAKYLNSYDSTIFNKSNTLYGLNFAKKHIKENTIIAEGYTDVMRSHENGIFNVVATLGTSLTENHIKLIKPYTNQITIAFDSDKAGIEASEKALELLLKQDVDADIIVLPNGHDIDSYLLENKTLPTAKNLLDWYCSNKLSQSTQRKEKANNKRKIIELINSISDATLRYEIKNDISEKYNIPLHYFNGNDSTPPATKASEKANSKVNTSKTPSKASDSENETIKDQKKRLTQIYDFWQRRIDPKTNIPYYIIDAYEFFKYVRTLGYKKLMLDNDDIFVYEKNNVIEEVTAERIKAGILKHFEEKTKQDKAHYHICSLLVKNRTKLLNKNLFELIESIEIETLRDTQKESFLFFKNGFVVVTAEKYILKPYSELKTKIWKSDIIQYDFVKITDVNQISKFCFYDFLTKITNDNEKWFQSLFTTIGYLAHTYNNPALTKAVVITDKFEKGIEQDGRSGKSLILQALKYVRSMFIEDGKAFKQNTQFSYQNVEQHHKIYAYDDIQKNFKADSMFSVLTTGITVEKKGKQPTRIEQKDMPKIAMTTNHILKKGIGGSYSDRLHEIELHKFFNANNKPNIHYNQLFFNDWNVQEWQVFYNVIILAIQEFLQEGLCEYKSDSLLDGQIITNTSIEFVEFIENFGIQKGTPYDKKQMYEDFKAEYPDFEKYKQRTFTKWLTTYAKYKNLEISNTKSGAKRFIIFS